MTGTPLAVHSMVTVLSDKEEPGAGLVITGGTTSPAVYCTSIAFQPEAKRYQSRAKMMLPSVGKPVIVALP